MVWSSYGGARDRIIRICAATTEARALRLDVLAEIRRTVGFDAYAWLLTDPQTCVGSAPLADVPCLPELPRLIRLKYLTATNRWTALPRSGVATLRTATAGDLTRSRLWREMLADYRITDVASVVFKDQYGCWGFLDLWRLGGADPAFSTAEAGFLAEIVPPVTAGQRQSQAATFTAQAPVGGRLGPVVLLLSADLELMAQTPETDAYLRALVPPAHDQPPVPAVTGGDTRELASRMVVSEHTVQDHLKSIFAKTSTRTRRALVSRALGG